MNKYGKFAILMAIIVGSLGFLAYSGHSGFDDLLQDDHRAAPDGQTGRSPATSASAAMCRAIRSFTKPAWSSSIWCRTKQILRVAYEGRDPLPDTFRDGAQALADGRLGPDGVFHASEIQAKCASKYAPKPGMAPDQLQPRREAGGRSRSPMRSSL